MTEQHKQQEYRGLGGRRVVMTGSGMITSLGFDSETNWSAIIAGQCGITELDGIELEGQEVHVGAQVRAFEPMKYMDRREARRMDRYCQFAVAAAVEAMAKSGLKMEHYGADRVGTIIGSGVGGLETLAVEFAKLHERGPARISPLFIPMMISNMAAGKVSMIYGTRGANYCVTTACASGTHAIGEAFRAIKYGHLDACIAGGAEAPITPIALAGFNNMTALTKESDPNQASVPFDARRNGFVIAEGAGIVVLEELESAVARGADIICEISGYGATADAYHITSPDPEGQGAAEAMRLAMAEAGLRPEDIGYINAHGTSTPLNDKYETIAIHNAFGDSAANVAVSSTKSMTGHLLGAAGAVEAIYTGLALRHGLIPPTINLLQPDPDCDLDYVPGKARKADIKAALSNSLGFGGHNGTLCLRKWEGKR
ncbi:MAG: beta-ketoacyl-ACP synthase II [Clostridiaceae bacterium]|nr:beta-ketoacyl-ACP synthase II [Clostridiaceae bacterium]